MKFLNKIKSRPSHEKNVVSLVLAGLFTFIIFSVWLGFGSNKDIQEETNKLSSVSPIQIIKEEFGRAYTDFKSQTPGLIPNPEEFQDIINEVESLESDASTTTGTSSYETATGTQETIDDLNTIEE
jgi:hypothetical protein